MNLHFASRLAFRVSLFGLLLIGGAQGALIPSGAPAHQGTQNAGLGEATASTGEKVRLVPNPAVFIPQGGCPWLIPALNAAAQPYNTDPNDVWTFGYAPLNADLTLNSYEAWADTSPTLTLGKNSFTYGKQPGRGGAGFELTYSPTAMQIVAGAPDPAKSTIRWVQVIDTNMPSDRGKAFGVASPANDGTTVYMDNQAAGTKNQAGIDPYYGHLTGFDTANGLGFVDLTNFDLASSVGLNWQAQAFLTTETTSVKNGITTHLVTIYDGAWWGFRVVPEPGTWLLLVVGSGGLWIFCPRRQTTSPRPG